MPPKVKMTKENIVEASLNIVRRDGITKLNARSVAKELKCSTQPIYSFYATMEALKTDVTKATNDYFDDYLAERISRQESTSPYGASGLAYIQFAKDEKELFKLLFMQDNIYAREWEKAHSYQIEMVKAATGLSKDNAKKFHLQMWTFVHGIATFFATSYLSISDEIINELMTRTSFTMLETYTKGREVKKKIMSCTKCGIQLVDSKLSDSYEKTLNTFDNDKEPIYSIYHCFHM